MLHSAEDEKLRTIHSTAVNNITVPIGNTLPLTVANTLSVDSPDYIRPFIFENNKPDKLLFSGGYCSFTASDQPVFHYHTQDHLGNNRAVVNENGTQEQVTHIISDDAVLSQWIKMDPLCETYKEVAIVRKREPDKITPFIK